MARSFRNPSNGYVEQATTSLSWFWVLILGPFYLLWRRYWGHAFISLIGTLLTYGLSNIVYAIAIYHIAPKHYLREGWTEVSNERTVDGAADALKVKEPTKLNGWKAAAVVPAWDIVAICLLAFVAALVLSRGMVGSKSADPVRATEAIANPSSNQAPGSDSIAIRETARSPLKLSASQAYTRITTNELRFRREVEEAGGVLVSGRVGHVESGLLGTGPVLSLKTGQPFIDILATLEHTEERKAERLDAGSSVRLLCHRPTTIGGGFAYLYDCRFR